jgi:hypothetical protein
MSELARFKNTSKQNKLTIGAASPRASTVTANDTKVPEAGSNAQHLKDLQQLLSKMQRLSQEEQKTFREITHADSEARNYRANFLSFLGLTSGLQETNDEDSHGTEEPGTGFDTVTYVDHSTQTDNDSKLEGGSTATSGPSFVGEHENVKRRAKRQHTCGEHCCACQTCIPYHCRTNLTNFSYNQIYVRGKPWGAS